MLEHEKGGIHGNPTSGPHWVLSHRTVQWEYSQTNTYLALKKRGRVGKNTAHKWQASNKAIAKITWRRIASKQLCIQVTRCPARGYHVAPSIVRKTANQHWFENNFA